MKSILLFFGIALGTSKYNKNESLNLKEAAKIFADFVDQGIINKNFTAIKRVKAILSISSFIVDLHEKINRGISSIKAIDALNSKDYQIIQSDEYFSVGNSELRLVGLINSNKDLQLFIKEGGCVLKRSHFWRPLGILPIAEEPEAEFLPGTYISEKEASSDMSDLMLKQLTRLSELMQSIIKEEDQTEEYRLDNTYIFFIEPNVIQSEAFSQNKTFLIFGRILFFFALYLLMCFTYIILALCMQNAAFTAIKAAFFVVRKL